MTSRRLMLLFAVVGCGCNDDSGPPPATPIFDTDVRGSYTQVRPCRSPGEHSGLNAFTVWVNAKGASSFADIWKTPPAVTELAAGSIVVKEIYTGTDCDPKTVERWVAMEKRPGFDPANGDWYWQEVMADGTVRANGADTKCITCHTGEASCDGYGLKAGKDYLCTAP